MPCCLTMSPRLSISPPPMPTSLRPVRSPPRVRNTNCAPRRKPDGVDHARDSSHTSSVFMGIGMASPMRDVRCHSPSLRALIGTTSMARPTLPPGRSG